MVIGQFVKRKNISDGQSVENISDTRLTIN